MGAFCGRFHCPHAARSPWFQDRKEREKERPAASLEPHGGRQDARAPDPAACPGQPHFRAPAPPLPPGRLQSTGQRGAQVSPRGWGRRRGGGRGAGRPSLLGLRSRLAARSRPRGPLRALIPFLGRWESRRQAGKGFPAWVGRAAMRGRCGHSAPPPRGPAAWSSDSSDAVPENKASCCGAPRGGCGKGSGDPPVTTDWSSGERGPGAVQGTHAGPRGLQDCDNCWQFGQLVDMGGRLPRLGVPSWCVLARGFAWWGCLAPRGQGGSMPARHIVALGRFLSPANLSPDPRPQGSGHLGTWRQVEVIPFLGCWWPSRRGQRSGRREVGRAEPGPGEGHLCAQGGAGGAGGAPVLLTCLGSE